MRHTWPADAPAAAATRRASTQSYLTIRFLADRAFRRDAFALYAYFRWLDDAVDEGAATPAERVELVARQRRLLERAAGGDGAPWDEAAPEERLLVAETLAGLRPGYPEVAVGVRLERGLPEDVLGDLAHDAALVVVGETRHGLLTDLVLGSVARSLLARGSCPVAVVPRPGPATLGP